jgi:hypothetical protein
MKLLNKLVVVATAGAALGLSGMQSANAASFTEMVTNGEFEQTNFSTDWTATKNVPGWQTTRKDGQIELWNGGKIGSPAIGSDLQATGKHMETNYYNNEIVSQTFKLLDNINTGIFSFDAWSRAGGTGKVSVTGSKSGSLLNQAIAMTGQNWTKNLFNLSVQGGEYITIAFQGDQNDSVKSPHIDQVSFQAATVPEPASMLGLLAVGTFGAVSTLKQKRKQEA